MAEDLRRMASSSSSQTMDMDDDDDDDPVIRTLPVYYTPHYLSTLTLLQYPDRLPRPDTLHPLLPPSMRPDPDDEGDAPPRVQLTARYKPVSQHLEVDIPVEKHHSRYNRDRAQTMAGGVIKPITTEDLKEEETKAKKRGRKPKVEPKAPVDEEDDEPKELEWMTYSSTSVPDVTNYLVGVVKDGALHLSPVTQTFQMRPSLNYLDNLITLERRKKREAKANADSDHESEGDISDAEIKKEEAKAVQVSVKSSGDGGKFAGPGNGRADASLFAPLRAEEGETWVKMTHHPVRSTHANDAFQGMFAKDESLNRRLVSVTKPSEYLG